MKSSPLVVGINARYSSQGPTAARDSPIGRTVVEEVQFAAVSGFQSIQFALREQDDYASVLGDPAPLRSAIDEAGIVPVVEFVIRVNRDGETRYGLTPLDVYKTHLRTITTLGCRCVHWHLVPREIGGAYDLDRKLEDVLMPQLAAAVDLSSNHGFKFGFEHNDSHLGLFSDPGRCSELLNMVNGLWIVWDFNHTAPDDVPAFLALAQAMSMLHVSDTPLPTTNWHLPLGEGRVDILNYCRGVISAGFGGPAILEIGGLPQSGGYGRDTDEKLIESLAILTRCMDGKLFP